jgi:hypothetical protein
VQELVRKDKKLECNEECSQLERNKRMALALQIRNAHSTTFSFSTSSNQGFGSALI